MFTGRIVAISAAAALWTCTIPVYARQTAPAAPSTQPAEVRQLNAKIVEVTGLVEVRDNDEEPFREAKVGMIVPVGGECRTGPKSSVTFIMPPRQVATLDRLGTVKILEAFQSGDMLKTDLGIKYGRLDFEIEAAGLRHESTIRSPSSALAVRGSKVRVDSDAFDSSTTLFKGLGERKGTIGPIAKLGNAPEDNHETNPLVASDKQPLASAYSYDKATKPLATSSLSGGEMLLASQNNALAGLQTGPMSFQHPTISGGGGLITNPSSNGTLSFILTWQTEDYSEMGLPRLDLFVTSPKNENLHSYTGPWRVASGGTISSDYQGGEAYTGKATAIWEKVFPVGRYTYGVHYGSETGEPAIYNIEVRINNTRVSPRYEDVVSEIDRDVTYKIDLPPAGGVPAASKGTYKPPRGTAAAVRAAARPAAQRRAKAGR